MRSKNSASDALVKSIKNINNKGKKVKLIALFQITKRIDLQSNLYITKSLSVSFKAWLLNKNIFEKMIRLIKSKELNKIKEETLSEFFTIEERWDLVFEKQTFDLPDYYLLSILQLPLHLFSSI